MSGQGPVDPATGDLPARRRRRGADHPHPGQRRGRAGRGRGVLRGRDHAPGLPDHPRRLRADERGVRRVPGRPLRGAAGPDHGVRRTAPRRRCWSRSTRSPSSATDGRAVARRRLRVSASGQAVGQPVQPLGHPARPVHHQVGELGEGVLLVRGGADQQTRNPLVAELLDGPERRQVAEVVAGEDDACGRRSRPRWPAARHPCRCPEPGSPRRSCPAPASGRTGRPARAAARPAGRRRRPGRPAHGCGRRSPGPCPRSARRRARARPAARAAPAARG